MSLESHVRWSPLHDYKHVVYASVPFDHRKANFQWLDVVKWYVWVAKLIWINQLSSLVQFYLQGLISRVILTFKVWEYCPITSILKKVSYKCFTGSKASNIKQISCQSITSKAYERLIVMWCPNVGPFCCRSESMQCHIISCKCRSASRASLQKHSVYAAFFPILRRQLAKGSVWGYKH